MFCNYCGAPNADDASFCNRCGKGIARPPARAAAREEISSKMAPPSAQGAAAAVAPAPESRRVAAAEKVRTLTGHTLPIYSLAFSPDGRWLASGSLDGTAKLWNAGDGSEVRTFTGNLAVACVEFSPDGRRLVIAATNGSPLNDKPVANAITLWDSSSPNEVRNLTGHQGLLFFVKFSPDGHLLATTDGAAVINLWDVSSGRIIKEFKYGWVRSKLLGGTAGSSLAFSPDGRLLATRSSPATLWDLASGKEVRTLGPEALSGYVSMFLGFTPDGQSIVQARGNGTIRIWDVASGKEIRCLADPPKRSGVTFVLRCAALSADGSLLAVCTYSSDEGANDKVTLWDVAAGRTLGTLADFNFCQTLAFSQDSQWLAVADMQCGDGKVLGKIRLWRTSEIR